MLRLRTEGTVDSPGMVAEERVVDGVLVVGEVDEEMVAAEERVEAEDSTD